MLSALRRSRGKRTHLGLSSRRSRITGGARAGRSRCSPEPGAAGGRAGVRSWGQGKGEVLKVFGGRQTRLHGQTGREARSGHLSRIF